MTRPPNFAALSEAPMTATESGFKTLVSGCTVGFAGRNSGRHGNELGRPSQRWLRPSDITPQLFDTNRGNRHNVRFRSEGFPSGQRDQTVNLTALPSKVRILPPPPVSRGIRKRSVPSELAGVAQW